MSYTKHEFKSGETLYASDLNEMDEQIFKNTEGIDKLSEDIADLKENGAGGGIAEETDPTVPQWAKQPTKPSYTAEEVGALSKDTKIPTKTSDLENDSEFVTETKVDEMLQNLPSGGKEKGWELINEITIEEAVNEIIISEDINGNSFSLEEIAFYFYAPKQSNSGLQFFFSCPMATSIKNNRVFATTATTSDTNATGRYHRLLGGFAGTYTGTAKTWYDWTGEKGYIQQFIVGTNSWLSAENQIPVGAKIFVYGIRGDES